jgi:hypothetical protein
MSAPLDWNQLAPLFGVAGVITGGVSAGINYLFERRRETGKRVAEVAREQLELYSAFLYNLRILHAAMDSLILTKMNTKSNYLNKGSKSLQIRLINSYRIRFTF